MQFYHFGKFQLDVAERRLCCNHEPVLLTPKQFELLLYFVEHAGCVATKNELLDAVWADAFVEESTLARNVSWLRKELRKNSNGNRFIETVPKLGYRFTAEVTHSKNDGNVIVIEEQTVQHFRGEETLTINSAPVERKVERRKAKQEVENKNFLPQNAPSLRRSFSVFALLFIILASAVLAGIGFAVYRNNPETAARSAESNAAAKVTIENITVDAARGTVDTGIKIHKGDIIELSVGGEYQHGTDQTLTLEGDKNANVSADFAFQNAVPRSLVGWIGTETGQDNHFQVSKTNSVVADRSGSLYFALNDQKDKPADNGGGLIVTVTLTRPAMSGNSPIMIGSIVNLQNRYPNGGGYLDAWGQVWSKPEFSKVRTETMFVSTHNNPNRDNGSGSWEIVSAEGKSNGEMLVVGDKVHLKNRHPNAGYLDNCGFVKHLPVFKEFLSQTSAVFTTKSSNRDNGTGTWIVKSAAKYDGSPVIEGDSISLKNGLYSTYNGEILEGGFLNVTGYVKDIPAFDDYDGARLVFTHKPSISQSDTDIWTITISKAVLK